MTTEFVRQDLDQNSSTTAEPDRVRVIRDGVASYLPDIDPEETAEWLESFDELLERSGPARARYLMLRLLERSGEQRVAIPALTSTDYVNTIPTELEPWFPGDEDVERRYRAWIRWNAAIMVHRAQRPGVGVGGHISTYASSAALYEVGFNHFFRGKSHPGGGDQIYIQGHASPGIYARAFLEGRLTADELDGFRQEHSHPGGGLPSYPHPRLMPDFWEFPTVSMGLGPMNAIYQARFNHYLHDRGIKDTSDQHVWAFLGDGETDEPESRGLAHVAALEGLDNLTFVINCNLQRLDGPVRGNGKIIQELESFFRGAGLERHQGGLGPRMGCAAARRPRRRAGQPDEHHPRRRLPDLQGQRRRLRPRTLLRPRPAHQAIGQEPLRRRHLEPQARRARLPKGVRRLPRGDGAQGPAHRHPGAHHQGLHAGHTLRGPQRHASDEKAYAARPQGLPRQPAHPDLRRRAGREPLPAAVLPPRSGGGGDPLPAGPAARARRLHPGAANQVQGS